MFKRILYYLPTIIFNVSEILVIVLIGTLLRLPLSNIIVLFILFAIVRMKVGKALHYKAWYKCIVMSTVFFLSLFVVVKVDIVIAISLTIFEGIILTSKGNINDIFMWGGNKLNKEVFDWVKYNQDNKLLKEYELNLGKTDKQKYIIFKYRFREMRSYEDISKIMDMDQQRLCEEIKVISHFIEYSIRLNTSMIIEEGE